MCVSRAIELGVNRFRMKRVSRPRPTATTGVPRTLRSAISAFTRVFDARSRASSTRC
jgi:hypothetical protein